MNREYFGNTEMIRGCKNIMCTPLFLYMQERDWTCSIACIRSLLSSYNIKDSEDDYINKYKLNPGPYYSKDIKDLHMLDKYYVTYGCDIPESVKTPQFMYDLLSDNYVMVETMYNYDHWLVVLGYLSNNENFIDKHKIILYDPYLNTVRIENAEEFFGMWVSGQYTENNIIKDFIAIRQFI